MSASQVTSRQPIEREILLAVEGRDMREFIVPLLEQLGLADRIDVRNLGGTPSFFQHLPALTEVTGFFRVNSLGIVIDAEANPHAAFQQVCTCLHRARLPVPKKPAVCATSKKFTVVL